MHSLEKNFTFNNKEYRLVILEGQSWTLFSSEGKNLTVHEFNTKGLVEAAIAVRRELLIISSLSVPYTC